MDNEPRLTDGLLDQYQAAWRLGISRIKLIRMRKAGRGPRYYCSGRKILYRREDLDAWHATQFRDPVAPDSAC